MNSFYGWEQPYFFDGRMPAGQGIPYGGQSQWGGHGHQYQPSAPSSWGMHDHWGQHGGKWCHHGPWQESNDQWGSHHSPQHHQWHQQHPWQQNQWSAPWGHQGQWAQQGGQWGSTPWHGAQIPGYGNQMGYMQG